METKTETNAKVKIEYEEEINIKKEANEITDYSAKIKEELKEGKTSPMKRKGKTPQTRKVKKEKPEDCETKWEPQNWKELLRNIKIMRQDENAPVDSQGCERTADETETPEVIKQFI